MLCDRGDRWTVGSGYLIGGTSVLTAAHNVQLGAGVLIRFRGGAERPCTVRELDDGRPALDAAVDLAVLDTGDAPPLPPVRFGRPQPGSRAEHAEYRSMLGIRLSVVSREAEPRESRPAASRQRQAGPGASPWVRVGSTRRSRSRSTKRPGRCRPAQRWPPNGRESPARWCSPAISLSESSPSTMCLKASRHSASCPSAPWTRSRVARHGGGCSARTRRSHTSSRPAADTVEQRRPGSAAEVRGSSARGLLTARGAARPRPRSSSPRRHLRDGWRAPANLYWRPTWLAPCFPGPHSEPALSERFPDGVAWIHVGQSPLDERSPARPRVRPRSRARGRR